MLLLATSPETKGSARIEKSSEDEASAVQPQDPPRPAEEEPPPPIPPVTDINDEIEDPDLNIRINTPKTGPVDVPGEPNPSEPVGIPTGPDSHPTDIPPVRGLGRHGLGGGAEGAEGTAPAELPMGGDGLTGSRKPGSFYGRSAGAKQKALEQEGGTKESEAAVSLGLEWIVRHQAPDGFWSLDGFHRHGHCNCRNRGNHHNDIAGTAFGLLPLLGAGHTHKSGKESPEAYRKAVRNGLGYLLRKQSRVTGEFGGGMYAHGLATIAVCEAYGLTQDPNLKRGAQAAVDYIVKAQHGAGGWRYAPRQAGDISVVGWQVMALKSAQMANLDVPARTLKKAIDFLDSIMADSDKDYGYGYTDRGQSSETRTAIGLLCRLYLQHLGPATKIMSQGVDNWIKKNPPKNGKNMYYYYYATQVLHHLNNKDWEAWNARMRDILVREQLTPRHPDWQERYKHELGSWSPEGDPYGGVGGRLMITSLSILTLEVYYRHLPLFRRESGGQGKDVKAK
jgi:hypothetical protein